MEQCRPKGWESDIIYTDCPAVLAILGGHNPQCNWRIHGDVQLIKDLLNQNSLMKLSYYPRELNNVVDSFAYYGRRNSFLSLFHCRTDRPRWLEDAVAASGLIF